jgi:hypothetical protein
MQSPYCIPRIDEVMPRSGHDHVLSSSQNHTLNMTQTSRCLPVIEEIIKVTLCVHSRVPLTWDDARSC